MLYLKEFLVGTAGEPFRNKINDLRRCEGYPSGKGRLALME